MSFLVLILLFLSTLHAYDARHLGFHSEIYAQTKASHLGGQDGKKTRLLDSTSSSLSRVEPYLISVGYQTDQPDRNVDRNRIEKTSSSEIDLQEGIKIEGPRRHRRLVREHAPDNAEKVDSEENEVGEDMVVMDYAQPHRKPPIHNEKP